MTPDLVEQRARETALINGRPADAFNEADVDQACAELTGENALEAQREEEPGEAAGTLRDIVPGSKGHKNVPKLPSDEQRLAELLVKEGVDEAEHHSMLAGSASDSSDRNS